MINGTSKIVAEEVKSFEGERFSLSSVRPHQRAYLSQVAEGGGLALLIVLDSLRRVHVIRWQDASAKTGWSHDELERNYMDPQRYVDALRVWSRP